MFFVKIHPMARPKRPSKYPKNYVKELRESRGISQSELARLTNTTQENINNLENAHVALTYEMMMKVANVLGCHRLEVAEGPIGSDLAALEAIMTELPPAERRAYLTMGRAFVAEAKGENYDAGPKPADPAAVAKK